MADSTKECACFDCELTRAYLAVTAKHGPSACKAVATLGWIAGMTIGNVARTDQRAHLIGTVGRSMGEGIAAASGQKHAAGHA